MSGSLTTDGVMYYVDGQRVEYGMVIRRYDTSADVWTEGKVGLADYDPDRQEGTSNLTFIVEDHAPLPILVGDTIEIVSKAELYNREMDRRDQIFMEHRDRPWLPLHDGE